MKEAIDVVDAHDNIVRQEELSVVLKKELLHRYVMVMVFNPSGELFMCKRVPSLFSGFWEGTVSDQVKSGETAQDAAFRLLHERLGVTVTPKHLKEVVRFGFHGEGLRVLTTLFAVRDYKESIEFEKDAVKEGSFWSMDKVKKELEGKMFFNPVFSKAVESFEKAKEPTKDFE